MKETISKTRITRSNLPRIFLDDTVEVLEENHIGFNPIWPGLFKSTTARGGGQIISHI